MVIDKAYKQHTKISSMLHNAGKTLLKSTKALLVNSIVLNDKWELPWRNVGKRLFNNRTEVEMMEIVGNFPSLQSERAIEVSIPIKVNKKACKSIVTAKSCCEV